MKIKFLRVVSILLFLQLPVFAELKLFEFKDKRVSIDSSKDWQIAEYLFNSPISILGPVKSGRRPVITFNPTTVEGFVFKKEELVKEAAQYQEGRQQWLKKNNGKLIKFLPYTNQNWPHVGEVHFVGYEYELMNQHFIEVDYFFNCQNELSNFHVLMTKEQNATHEASVNKIIKSIKCLQTDPL